jgi:drug/metabolite transporter (DMT)-like permease
MALNPLANEAAARALDPELERRQRRRLRKRRRAYLLLALLLILDVSCAIMQKQASRDARAMGGDYGWGLLLHPWSYAAFALAPIQLLVWTRILRTLDISLAYPLTSLGYPLTMIAAMLLFREERYAWQVWLGAGLVTLGAAVLGPGKAPAE